jgi:hypothetical protein
VELYQAAEWLTLGGFQITWGMIQGGKRRVVCHGPRRLRCGRTLVPARLTIQLLMLLGLAKNIAVPSPRPQPARHRITIGEV